MSDPVAAYARVLRHGRAPDEGVRQFAAAIEAADKEADPESRALGRNQVPNDTHAAVLADFLEEHGDPRHHIVRGDLEIRAAPGPHWQAKSHNHTCGRLGCGRDALHYGSWMGLDEHHGADFDLQPVSRRDRVGVQGYRASWTPTREVPFEAFLTPDQADELAREYGITLDHGFRGEG